MRPPLDKEIAEKTLDGIVLNGDEMECLESAGANSKFREDIIRIARKHGITLIVLEPAAFDKGVKRYGQKRDGYVVVYDYDKTAEALAESYMESDSEWKPTDMEDAMVQAYEWLDFNTIRGIPYMGPYAPKVVYTPIDGKREVVMTPRMDNPSIPKKSNKKTNKKDNKSKGRKHG